MSLWLIWTFELLCYQPILDYFDQFEQGPDFSEEKKSDKSRKNYRRNTKGGA
jgi:hypothetical protein